MNKYVNLQVCVCLDPYIFYVYIPAVIYIYIFDIF